MIVSLQLCLILNLHPAPTVASLPSLAAPKRERPRPATVGKKLGLARVRLAKVTVAEVCSCMLAPTLLLQYQTLAEAEQSQKCRPCLLCQQQRLLPRQIQRARHQNVRTPNRSLLIATTDIFHILNHNLTICSFLSCYGFVICPFVGSSRDISVSTLPQTRSANIFQSTHRRQVGFSLLVGSLLTS